MIDGTAKGVAETGREAALPVVPAFIQLRKEEGEGAQFKQAPRPEGAEEVAEEPGMLLASDNLPVVAGSVVGIVVLVAVLAFVMKRDMSRANAPRGEAPRRPRQAATGSEDA